MVVCYIAHKGGVCVREASRLEQPVHSAVAETRLKQTHCSIVQVILVKSVREIGQNSGNGKLSNCAKIAIF